MKIKSIHTDLAYVVPFFMGLILQVLAIDLFRLTFISLIISVGLYIISGIIGFVLLRRKLAGAQRLNLFRVFISLTYCIVSIGGTLTFLFLATNFYLAKNSTTRQSFAIEKTGKVRTRYSNCVESYAVIKKGALKKEITFKCDQLDKIGSNKKVDLAISEGALGFDIIRDRQIIQ